MERPPVSRFPMPSPYANPTSALSPHPGPSSSDTSAPHKSQTASCKRDCSQATQPLLLHFSTLPAIDPPHIQLQIDPSIPAGQVPYATNLLVVVASVNRTVTPAYRFSCVRSSLDHPCPGISKYPSNLCSWTISGEPILVQQSSPFSHPVIIQVFLPKENYLFRLFHAILSVFWGIILLTHL